MSLAPKVGDTITQTQMFEYLFTGPGAGDWLRYRLSTSSDTIIFKTIGFGPPDEDANTGAYIEIDTESVPITSAPTLQTTNVGGAVVWKMYVNANDFTDPLRLYSIGDSAFKIGDGFFRLRHSMIAAAPAPEVSLHTLLWSGLVPLDDSRQGVVRTVTPRDVKVRGRELHCTYIAVDFKELRLPAGSQFPSERIEIWQTPDIPVGTERIRTTVLGHTYDAELVAFGRGSYHPIIDRPIAGMAAFPGSL
ncbi:MAG: hypothetical protein M3Z37_03260 [Candidatus Eremiobacteraeota bacterium]|nr:hypothetical protein [Candidatus Eremiobacteraeota bacterium]